MTNFDHFGTWGGPLSSVQRNIGTGLLRYISKKIPAGPLICSFAL